jgi:threonine dehydrogenase-like Zn-dependent dehydrogenase
MKSGDILGHEHMGIVIEVGPEVSNLKKGDRAVVPLTISCGQCWFCTKGLFSACERTNPNAEFSTKAMGHSLAGLFGFSHMLGGYSGGQAEYLRVPMADVGPIKIPENVTDDRLSFSRIFFPPVTWPPRTRRLKMAAPWRFGGVARSASSQFDPL